MIVFECCDREVVTIEQGASLVEAAQLMRKFHVGYVVVVDDKAMQCIPLGIVTDRDVVIEAVATELDPEVITVGDIMISPLLIVNMEADLEKTLDVMATQGVRRLPVVDEVGGLLGVVTLDGLLIKTTSVLSSFSKLIAHEKANELKHRR